MTRRQYIVRELDHVTNTIRPSIAAQRTSAREALTGIDHWERDTDIMVGILEEELARLPEEPENVVSFEGGEA